MNSKNVLLNVTVEILGSFMLAIGIFCFAEQVNVAPGGVSGIAIMLKYLFNLPVGITSLIINIPLLILAYKFISPNFAFRSLRALIFLTIIIDYIVTPFFPQYAGERMLGAIFGGVFMGSGLGSIFFIGSSTAGTDILSYLVGKKFPQIPIGKAIMLIDTLILASSILVFKNIESAMLGVIALFFQTVLIDKIVYSTEGGRNILIISEKTEEIAKKIITQKRRGATFLNAEGAYSGKPTKVLMCAVRGWEYHEIKKIIHQTDPKAFVIAAQAENVLGEGFSNME